MEQYISSYQREVERKAAGSTVTYRHFDSVDEYSKLTASKTNIGKDMCVGGSDWYGCSGREEALRIVRNGVWPEGMARMERELAGFEVAHATSIKRKAVWSDQGDSLDIHKVYGGQLDTAWRRTVRRPKPASNSVVISFPLMIAGGQSADKLFWCGAAALKLTEVLTVAGYNVTLIGTHGTTSVSGRETCYDSLVVKAAESPLDVEALMVSVAFTGFVRTVGFTAIASNDFTVNSGLGHAHYDPAQPLEALGLPVSSLIRDLFSRVYSRDTARDWIQRHIDRLQTANADVS